MTRAALSLLFCLVALAACEKDPRYMSPQKYLSRAPWKLAFSQSVTTEGSASDTVDYFAQMDSCQQDIRYFFATNGSYYSEPGNQRCPGQNLNRKDLGRWKYETDTKTLVIDGAGRLLWTVLALNDSSLKIRLIYTLQDSLRQATVTEENHYIHP